MLARRREKRLQQMLVPLDSTTFQRRLHSDSDESLDGPRPKLIYSRSYVSTGTPPSERKYCGWDDIFKLWGDPPYEASEDEELEPQEESSEQPMEAEVTDKALASLKEDSEVSSRPMSPSKRSKRDIASPASPKSIHDPESPERPRKVRGETQDLDQENVKEKPSVTEDVNPLEEQFPPSFIRKARILLGYHDRDRRARMKVIECDTTEELETELDYKSNHILTAFSVFDGMFNILCSPDAPDNLKNIDYPFINYHLHDTTIEACGSYIYLIGGNVRSKESTSEVLQFSLKQQGDWNPVASLLLKREDHASVIYENVLYVAGGWNRDDGNLADCEKMSLKDEGDVGNFALAEWKEMASLNVIRSNLSLVECKGEIYAMGGFTTDTSQGEVRQYVTGSVERIKPDGDSWKEVCPMRSHRARFGSAAYNGNIYAFGGFYGHMGNDMLMAKTVEYYQTDHDQWTYIIQADMPYERCSFSSCIIEDRIYIIGGWNSKCQYVDRMYMLQLDKNPQKSECQIIKWKGIKKHGMVFCNSLFLVPTKF